MKIGLLLLRVLFALVAFVILAIAGLCLYLPPMCGNHFIEAIPSPGGTQKIIIFQRDCGATTGVSTQDSLLSTSEDLPNTSGNLFTSDTNDGAAPVGRGGGPALHVVWHSADFAAIAYHPAVRVFKAEPDVAGVRFIYSTTEHTSKRSAPADRPTSALLTQNSGHPLTTPSPWRTDPRPAYDLSLPNPEHQHHGNPNAPHDRANPL